MNVLSYKTDNNISVTENAYKSRRFLLYGFYCKQNRARHISIIENASTVKDQKYFLIDFSAFTCLQEN